LQAAASIDRQGLPFWILYLLLCIIILLLTFIFLRDKDLRMRLDEFLLGAKRRMKRAQLQLRLNREKRKKTGLLKELGKKAWTDKLRTPKYQSFLDNLERLEKLGSARQAELKAIQSKIAELHKNQEDARETHKKLLKLKENGHRPDGQKIHASNEELKRFKKEAKDFEKKFRAGQKIGLAIDRQKEEGFVTLGTIVDKDRPEHKNFLGLYVQIDKMNRNILHYMNEIEKLH
jgi:hypothetical protein